jgi:RNA-binding protein 25
VQGVNGKLQTFGFCEFDNPDATLRCIRLLNGYEIAEKKLSVKVDQKTKEQLSEYIKKTNQLTKNAKKAVQQRGMPNKKTDSAGETDCLNLELVDENTLKDDRVVIGSFEILLRQYATQLKEILQENAQEAAAVTQPPVDGTTPAGVQTPEQASVKVI